MRLVGSWRGSQCQADVPLVLPPLPLVHGGGIPLLPGGDEDSAGRLDAAAASDTPGGDMSRPLP